MYYIKYLSLKSTGSLIFSHLFHELANFADVRSQKMQAIEGELQLVVEKEHLLDQKLHEVTTLRNDLEKVKLEQDQRCRLLQNQVARLAKDKEALEGRYKSLQEKNKSSAKKHKGKLLILFCSLIFGWSSSSPSIISSTYILVICT